MKSIKEIKESKEITVIEKKFEKVVGAGVGCPCRVFVSELGYHVVAAYFIEVVHPDH